MPRPAGIGQKLTRQVAGSIKFGRVDQCLSGRGTKPTGTVESISASHKAVVTIEILKRTCRRWNGPVDVIRGDEDGVYK